MNLVPTPPPRCARPLAVGVALALALPGALAACGAGSAASPPGGDPPPALRCGGTAAPLPDHLAIGYAGDLAAVGHTGFDLRYQYLAGVLAPDPACLDPARAKAAGCGAEWWGTWQWDQEPPGQFVSGFAAETAAAGLRPMITYYVLFQAARQRLRIVEGTDEVTVAARDRAFMKAYLDDFRFFLRRLGSVPAVVHVEPDFWGYAQHAARAAGTDAHGLPAAVASANPADCGAAEDSIAGLGRCMISMVRTYAPGALVSLHGSAWASGFDCVANRDASLDVAAEARKTGDFLLQAGGDCADLTVIDLSDRDAGWYARQSPPRDTWLSAAPATLPSFAQAFAWSAALSARTGRPALWWQVPVGNMTLGNTCGAYQDDKLNHLFDQTADVVAGGAVGMAFGSGADCQTTPMSDGGHLVARAAALDALGGQPLR